MRSFRFRRHVFGLRSSADELIVVRKKKTLLPSRSLILKDCIKGPEKKRKLVLLCSRPRQIVKLGTYMFVVVQRRLRNVQKRVVHVQSCYLPKKTYCFFAVLVAVAVVDA